METQRFGYPDCLRSTENEIWQRLRKRFLRRLRALQKHESTFRTPYRSNPACEECGKTWKEEQQYVNGTFVWTTTFRHRVRLHDEYVSPAFWLYVLKTTLDVIELSKYERKVLKAYAALEIDVDKIVDKYRARSTTARKKK